MKKFNDVLGDVIDPATLHTVRNDQRLKQLISQTVPAQFHQYVQFCRIEDGTLRVVLANASVLARLRFYSRQLIDELSMQNIPVSEVSWHVAAQQKAIELPEKNARAHGFNASRPRSSKASAILQSAANSMDDQDRLCRALAKMAQSLAGKSPRTGKPDGSDTGN